MVGNATFVTSAGSQGAPLCVDGGFNTSCGFDNSFEHGTDYLRLDLSTRTEVVFVELYFQLPGHIGTHELWVGDDGDTATGGRNRRCYIGTVAEGTVPALQPCRATGRYVFIVRAAGAFYRLSEVKVYAGTCTCALCVFVGGGKG